MKERKAKTPRIQPQDVVKAALEILDGEGLECITLRGLATKLGVQAPALYWYFKDKQDIIDDMAQAILITDKLSNLTFPQDKEDWPKWLKNLASSTRDALMAHRDGGKVVAGASFSRAHALAGLSFLATKVLIEAGFTPIEASVAASTIFDYVWGFVIEEQSSTATPDDTRIKRSIGHTIFERLSEENLQLWDQITDEKKRLTSTGQFDRGLDVIIEGLESTLRKVQ
jgi:TetR/AcrR family transcriptional regulator, tetracycline repressor protein